MVATLKKNNILYEEDYALVELLNVHRELTGYAKIDIEDIEFISKTRWYKSKDGYAVSTDKNKTNGTSYVTMHGLIINNLCGFYNTPDHANLDRLDNRRFNLRIANRTEQQANHNKSIRNTSGIIGVSWSNDNNLWLTRLNKNNKCVYLEYFNNKDNAIVARLEAEKKYFGEFAPQKHLYKEYGLED